MDVTVPPNTSATLYFPADKGVNIRISSQFAVKSGSKNGYEIYILPAGKYVFSGNERL